MQEISREESSEAVPSNPVNTKAAEATGSGGVTADRKPQVVVSPKNVGISIILTVLFGPLGMFYSTIGGGIIMSILSAIIGILTFGFGLLITWPICIVWGALSTVSHNKKLLK